MGRNRKIVFGIGLAFAIGFLTQASPAIAQDAVTQAPSLKWAPADAASFSVMLRAEQQFNAMVNSKAWARLMSLPVVKMAKQKFDEEWANPTGPLAPVSQWYQQPGMAELVKLLCQLGADEVFAYGGANSAEFFALLMELNMANQMAPLMLLGTGDLQAINDPRMRAKVVLQALADNAERLKIPDLVFGFRLSKANPQAVAKYLEMLEHGVTKAAPPEIASKFKKTKVHGSDVLTFVLEGKDVPWDHIPIGMVEEFPGQFDKLIKQIKSMKLTFSLGIRDGYLLVGLGEGTAGLASLNPKAAGRLSERKELAPLAQFQGKPLVAIAYVSQEFQKVASGNLDPEETLKWISGLLKAAELPQGVEAKIKKDLKALAEDMKRLSPHPGASLTLSYLTSKGFEGYTCDWTTNHGLDGTKPLALLNHVGGNPIAFYIERNKISVEDYETTVKWIKLAYRYFEELAVPKLPEFSRPLYEDIMKKAIPLFERFDKATAKMFIPANEGEGAIVLDAKLKSKQWHPLMPASEKDLALPEIAIIEALKDAGLFRKAFAEYREIFNDFTAAMLEVLPPFGLPEIKIPEPQIKKVKGGTLYFYPLPPEVGLDNRIILTGGISDKMAVFALSHEHTLRLLNKTPITEKIGVLTDANRPLAGATYLNWAGLMDLAAPWVDYGLTQAHVDNEIREQVQVVLEILKVWRSYASITYLGDGVTITHSEMIIRDLQN